eukprot:762052-Hanusia_phi.AAC.4
MRPFSVTTATTVPSMRPHVPWEAVSNGAEGGGGGARGGREGGAEGREWERDGRDENRWGGPGGGGYRGGSNGSAIDEFTIKETCPIDDGSKSLISQQTATFRNARVLSMETNERNAVLGADRSGR